MSEERRDISVPVGPLVATLGAVLLVVSLFLDWYDGRTGFTVFEVLDLVLVGCALLVVVQLAGGMGVIRPAVSPGVSLAVTIFTLVVVASQLVNHPPAAVGVDEATGIWLGLAGAGVMVIGAVLATAHLSLAVEPRADRREERAAARDDRPDPSVAPPTVRGEGRASDEDGPKPDDDEPTRALGDRDTGERGP